jgi:hypothetical protein
MPYGTHGHGSEVLMFGRSVMGGWFDHWGWDGQDALLRSGYAFYYGELDSPPEIANTAVTYLENVPPTTIVFFKLCFVDFWARSADQVQPNVQENLGYVEAVVDAAVARGTPLVLATALPDTQSNTTAALVEAHREFNEGVRLIADERPGVYVFDMHDVLTNQQGALYKGFAVLPSDAHLTDVAYSELDDALFDFLDSHFGSTD